MAAIKLTDYEDASSTFTLPYNPQSIEFAISPFRDQRSLPYSFTILGFTSPIKSSISIVFNGHFSGTNKDSNYRSLVSKVNNKILLKLYYLSDYSKFYLCTGMGIQKVPSGNRPNHVDYVANFYSPFGILFSDTQKSGAYNSASKNDGDIVTPIEKITGSVTNGVAVTIKDDNNNGFTFTPNATGTMTYYMVKILSSDNNIYLTEYMYVEVGGTEQIITNASENGDIMLKIEPGESLNDLFAAGTISGITPTFYFRDGYTSD